MFGQGMLKSGRVEKRRRVSLWVRFWAREVVGSYEAWLPYLFPLAARL